MLLELADTYPILFLLPFIALHVVWRARAYKAPAGWKARALIVTGVSYAVSLAVGIGWAAVLPGASLVDGAALGTVGGALLGIVLYELAHYGYHRAAHSWNWLWRLGHQMHHSAESLDAFGAYYLHPIDAALFTTWAVLVFYPLLGLTPEAGALAAAFLAFNAAFHALFCPGDGQVGSAHEFARGQFYGLTTFENGRDDIRSKEAQAGVPGELAAL